MFCPDCGSEYREGFSRCVDCEVDLVDELPASPPPEPWELATVFSTVDPLPLARAKSLLDDAGLPYLTRGEGAHDRLALEDLPPDTRLGPLELQVGRRDWETAERLLRAGDLEPVEATPEEQGLPIEPMELMKKEEEWERPAPAIPPDLPALSADRLRAWELALVVLVGFGSVAIGSTWAWWTGVRGPLTSPGLIVTIEQQFLGLALLGYVLYRRSQRFRDLGLTFAWIEIPAALFLTFAAFLADRLTWRALTVISLLATDHPLPYSHRSPAHPEGWVLALFLLFQVVNAFHEELLARAFTMTEVQALTDSAGLAIATSVCLQTFYHLYLGLPNALAAAATFLLYSVFYWRFRRITPIILSHLLWDLIVVLRPYF